MAIRLKGSTSGSVELDVPAAVSGGDVALTLPNGIGSAEQFLKNSGTAGELEFSSMVETSTGVGIGTSSPDQLAHIHKTSGSTIYKASVAGNSTVGLEIAKTGSTTQSWRIVDGQTVNGKLEFYDVTDSATRMCIDGSGNVGIGTTSPSNIVHVHQTDATANSYIHITHADGGSGATDGLSVGIEDGGVNAVIRNRENGYLRMFTNNTERMRIDSSGRVAIGTTSATTNAQLTIAHASSPFLSFERTEGGRFDAAIGMDGSADLSFYTGANSSDVFGLTERMRIDGSGRLLHNTTSTGTANIIIDSQLGNGSALRLIGKSANDGSEIDFFADNNSTRLGYLEFNNTVTKLVSETSVPLTLHTNGTERMRIRSDGETKIYDVYTRTDAASPNMVVKSDGSLRRSTSSIKYKTNVETLEDNYADAILNVRPVWYRSLCEGNPQEHSYYGFIAEEVAEIDPRLVHFKTTEVTYNENGSTVTTPCDPEPEGVQYDRFVPHLLNLIKRQQAAIETLETKVAALEAG